MFYSQNYILVDWIEQWLTGGEKKLDKDEFKTFVMHFWRIYSQALIWKLLTEGKKRKIILVISDTLNYIFVMCINVNKCSENIKVGYIIMQWLRSQRKTRTSSGRMIFIVLVLSRRIGGTIWSGDRNTRRVKVLIALSEGKAVQAVQV